MGLEERLRGHRQRKTGRRKWGNIRDSRNRKGRLVLRWRSWAGGRKRTGKGGKLGIISCISRVRSIVMACS